MNAFERNKKLLELIQFAENSGNNMGGGTQIPQNAPEYLSTSPTVGENPFEDIEAPSLFKPWNIIREKMILALINKILNSSLIIL